MFVVLFFVANVGADVVNSKGQCRLDQHPSVEYRCILTGTIKSSRVCGAAEPAGTIVSPRCRRPNYYSSTPLTFMRCFDGYWDHIERCSPECGRVTPDGKGLVVGGQTVKRGELPWHAGIYSTGTNPYIQICGGSLISNSVVLSAAHCFYTDLEKQLPASKFSVAVGKLYRPWNDKVDQAQKSKVKVIHLPEHYQGITANFQDDIAVVIVAKEFVFKTYIRPACLSFDYHFEKQQLYSGNKGKVAGWGLTAANGKPSPVLQVVDLPYVEVRTCINRSPPDFREYITSDKICAGTLEPNSALCKGDSGGGLAFPESIQGIERYYLRGIVSTAPTSDNTCNTDTYTSFTSVMKHEHFIKQFWSESGQFKCQDGSFITAVNYCDGTKECPDGSDETSWACTSKICSEYLFQCAYGACVDRGATCNGIQECADGSDEAQELCGTSASTVTEPTTENCVLPPYPNHGVYISNTAEVYPGGEFKNVTLEFRCRQGYGVLGSEFVTCQDGVWQDSVPKCVRLCRLDSHPSVEYHCTVSGDITGIRKKCKEYEPDGTIVIPECKKPNYYSPITLTFMRCIDGYWDYIARCSPECGTVTPNGMELVVGGLPAKKGEVPWHAGIYLKTYNPYLQICGGSLISNTFIISGAHCFWTELEKQLPESQFAVAVGKLYRPWNDTMDEAQKSDVKKINLPPRYQGEAANYQDDIALVEVEKAFEYKTYIRPVCISFDINFERQQLQPNNKGKVAGWGLTAENGKASPVLQVIDLPYVDIETCIANSPPNFREYITSDKICAGTLEPNSALCKGDAAGGLAFPATEKGIERFYLRGIVSTAPNNDNACNTAAYISCTQITKHERFIKQFWTGF